MSNSFNIITRNYSKTLRKFQSQSVFRNIRKMCSSTEESRIIYKKAEEYWSQVSQDVNSMLGGFESLHQPDIIASKNFINHLKKKNLFLSKEYALDCGAGIGRVTKNLLMPIFEKVDLVDVTKDLIEQSDNYIGPTNKVKEKFVEGLQTFDPPKNRYDLIWIQWVSGYLIDEDFIQFFQRCAKSLKPGGCIVLKDNIIKTNKKAVFDNEDNSWTRTEKELITLFEKANLDIASKSLQAGFPKDMYPVKMFALKPKTDLCE